MARRSVGVFRLVGIGWYIGSSIVLGALGGRWLGQKLDGDGLEAILMIVGLLLGVLVAFYGTYRMVKEIGSDD
jgi:hypothetical protein